MITFKNLSFREHQYIPNSKQATVKLDNGIEISVLLGDMFYSDGINTYEFATIINGEIEPEGWLSPEEIDNRLIKLQS